MQTRNFFYNDTATAEFYTLSLHDALPIWLFHAGWPSHCAAAGAAHNAANRSEEHTSELQSHHDLVCRPLLEKKKEKESPLRHNAPALWSAPVGIGSGPSAVHCTRGDNSCA